MKSKKSLLLLALLAVMIIPRLPALDSFVTIDEPFWLSVGANYYYALGQREFENTVYEYHPAVTTMSFVTAAFLVDFPEYRGLGQGYFDVDKEKFDPFLIEHSRSPMHLLYLSRLFQLAVIIVLGLVIFYLLSLVIGDIQAFLVTAFTYSTPYFLGHSRVLSHEALVAALVLASIFGMVAYLEGERKWYHLLISAASAALAQLTKSSAMALFPVIILILCISAFETSKARSFRAVLAEHIKTLALWFLELALVYTVLWPGMWVAPGKMLYEVYGNAFSYAFQGARLQVTHELEPSTFTLAAAGQSIRSFAASVLWRSTPIAWVGWIMTALFLFSREETKFLTMFKKLTAYLVVTAAMFILLFSLAQGRNSAHYIMASHVSLDVVAVLGWCGFIEWLRGKRHSANDKSWYQYVPVSALVFLQLGSALLFYPYYYTYINPILKGVGMTVPLSDYGEGFEKAAEYLAEKPNAQSIAVLAFRGRGPFSYFFPGKTIILNPLFMEDAGMPSLLERIYESDYLVINDALGRRTSQTESFVKALEVVQPEKIIEIKGVHTIRIYRIADLPASFYEAISQ